MSDVVPSHWEVRVDNTGGSTSRANAVRSDTLAMLERPRPFDIYMSHIGKATMIQSQLVKINKGCSFFNIVKNGGRGGGGFKSILKRCSIRIGVW